MLSRIFSVRKVDFYAKIVCGKVDFWFIRMLLVAIIHRESNSENVVIPTFMGFFTSFKREKSRVFCIKSRKKVGLGIVKSYFKIRTTNLPPVKNSYFMIILKNFKNILYKYKPVLYNNKCKAGSLRN